MEPIIAGFFGLFALVYLGVGFYNMGLGIYHIWDHSKWADDAVPDSEAKVVDMKSEQVKYVKNGAKFKTTVTFSDGFTFVTHKTHRENHFGSYTISVNKMEILEAALEAHKKAVEKKAEKSLPAPAPAAAPARVPVQDVPKPVADSPKPDEDDTFIFPNYPAYRPTPADDYPATKPLNESAADSYPVTKPLSEANPAADSPADNYPVTRPLSEAKPVADAPADSYPVTKPLSEVNPATDSPADNYPVTKPLSEVKPAAEDAGVPETTRWICPRCGLVHSKALQVCFHCGTAQKEAKRFV